MERVHGQLLVDVERNICTQKESFLEISQYQTI